MTRKGGDETCRRVADSIKWREGGRVEVEVGERGVEEGGNTKKSRS